MSDFFVRLGFGTPYFAFLPFENLPPITAVLDPELRKTRGQARASASCSAEGRAQGSHSVGYCNAPRSFHITAGVQGSTEKQYYIPTEVQNGALMSIPFLKLITQLSKQRQPYSTGYLPIHKFYTEDSQRAEGTKVALFSIQGFLLTANLACKLL